MAEIRWFGHNCFRIRFKEATVITDPVGKETGYSLPKQSADIVTISHHHPGHANLAAIRNDPPYKVIEGPGEYEISGVFVTGVRTYHDTKKGAERGRNTIYLIEAEGLTMCHLGDLGHPLSQEQAEALSLANILFIPAGGDGSNIISPAQAADIITQLEPSIVIPMQYATATGDKGLGDLETFCKQIGVEVPEPTDKLTVRQTDITESVRFVVLNPET